MQSLKPIKPMRTAAFFLAVLLLFLLLPSLPAQAAARVTVTVSEQDTLEEALSKLQAQGTDLSQTETLIISGEDGLITSADGDFVRETLLRLTTLNLAGYRGEFGPSTFRNCTTLEKVILPNNARLSREMFYGCTSLEDVSFPNKYALMNGCFHYCALDFSKGYPSLINDRNVLTYAAGQRPKAYFSLTEGSEATIMAHTAYKAPYTLRTVEGTGYVSLAANPPIWLITRPDDLTVTETVFYDGAQVPGVDTSVTGVYTITYSLPPATFADTRTLEYTLTVKPNADSLDLLIGQVESRNETGYTAASWRPVEKAVADAKAVEARPTATQEEIDEVATALAQALKGLEVTFSGAPDTVHVGDSFYLIPGGPVQNGPEWWDWDATYFRASFTGGPATFQAIKEGSTTIQYENEAGEKGSIAFTIQPGTASVPQQVVDFGLPAATLPPPVNYEIVYNALQTYDFETYEEPEAPAPADGGAAPAPQQQGGAAVDVGDGNPVGLYIGLGLGCLLAILFALYDKKKRHN